MNKGQVGSTKRKKKATNDGSDKKKARNHDNNNNAAMFQRHRRPATTRVFDPDDVYALRARVANERFTSMVNLVPTGQAASMWHDKRATQKLTIESIDVISNPTLEAKFDAFKARLINDGVEAQELLLFHGTPIMNVDAILANNFDPSKIVRTAYGWGMYFSDFPSVSMRYGNTLLMCRVLLGRRQLDGPAFDPNKGFDSFTVQYIDDRNKKRLEKAGLDLGQSSEIHVIKHPDQILPFCVLNLKGSQPSDLNLVTNANNQTSTAAPSSTVTTGTISSGSQIPNATQTLPSTSGVVIVGVGSATNVVVRGASRKCSVCYKDDDGSFNAYYGPLSCSSCRQLFVSMATNNEFTNYVECIETLEGRAMCLTNSVRGPGSAFMNCYFCRFAACLIAGLNWSKLQSDLILSADQKENLRDFLTVFIMDIQGRVQVPQAVISHLSR